MRSAGALFPAGSTLYLSREKSRAGRHAARTWPCWGRDALSGGLSPASPTDRDRAAVGSDAVVGARGDHWTDGSA